MTFVYWCHCPQETSKATKMYLQYALMNTLKTWIQARSMSMCDCPCAGFHCVSAYELPPLSKRLFHFIPQSVCADRWTRAIPVAVLWRQRGNRGTDMSIKACLFAFVWWPSKTSIAILASHRIGLLYKNTPASILQAWSGAEGVGAAGGGKEGWTKYSSEKLPAVSCFVNSLHSLITLYFTPYFIFPFIHSQITQHMLFLYYLYVIFCTIIVHLYTVHLSKST